MVMLTKIAKNPQTLTCKSNEETKGPPLKVANMAKMARNRSGDLKEMANMPKMAKIC